MKNILEERERELREEDADAVFPAYELVGPDATQALLRRLYTQLTSGGEDYASYKLDRVLLAGMEAVDASFVVDAPGFCMESLLEELRLTEREGYVWWIPHHQNDDQICRVNLLDLGNILPRIWYPSDDIFFFPESLSWLLYCWHQDGFFSIRRFQGD